MTGNKMTKAAREELVKKVAFEAGCDAFENYAAEHGTMDGMPLYDFRRNLEGSIPEYVTAAGLERFTKGWDQVVEAATARAIAENFS